MIPATTLEAMIRAGAAALEASPSARLDARVLAKFVLKADDATLISNARSDVPDALKQQFDDLIGHRAAGAPVAYLTGKKEFWGLEFAVNRSVLIPRSDSECIVEAVIKRCDRRQPLRILDLGTGSGCLLCALLSELPRSTGLGVDISEAAISTARQNAEALGFADRASFLVSDWFDHVDGVFDVIVANAPYIPERDRERLAVDVAGYEPPGALFGGADGLAHYRQIYQSIPGHIGKNSIFAVEYGDASQGETLRKLPLGSAHQAAITVIWDLAGRERGMLYAFGG